MSTSIALISLDASVPVDDYERLTNERVAHGNEEEVCRLFRDAGVLDRLLTEAGGEAMPYAFLQNKRTTIFGTSDETWRVSADDVRALWEGIEG